MNMNANEYTRCDLELTVILKFRGLSMFDVRISMSIYVDYHQSFWIVNLFLTDKKLV